MATPIRVLLIDDERTYYALVSEMLNRTSTEFVVDWSQTYDDGTAALIANQHDIALVDYRLGPKNGLDLVQSVYEYGVTTPMIVVTSMGDHTIGIQALRHGAIDYFDKRSLTSGKLHQIILDSIARASLITEQRERMLRYRQIVEDAYDGIIIADNKGKIQLSNHTIRRLLGYPYDQYKEMSIYDLLVASDGKSLAWTNPGAGVVMECALKCADGTVLDVELSGKQIADDCVEYIFRDNTEHRTSLAERDRYIEQLTILHQVDDELSQTLNIDYVLTMALDAGVRLSGASMGFILLIDSGKIGMVETIGNFQLAAGDDLPDLPLLKQILADGRARLHTDDAPEATMALPLNSVDRLIGVLYLKTDRAERFTNDVFRFLKLVMARVAAAIENAYLYKASQDQIQELQAVYEQVSRLEQLKTDMIRIAAHDLGNLNAVVLTHASLLRRVLGPAITPDQTKFVERILDSSRRMAKLTRDFLSLENIENSLSEGVQVVFDLRELVDDACGELIHSAELKSQQFEKTVPALPVNVRADSAHLRQAVGNLVSNAIKYTPDRGKIGVHLQIEGDQAVLRVVDTGMGVEEVQMLDLFKPFTRADEVKGSGIEGTGLGLYLVKNIIERSGGTIIAESVHHAGSTFGFRLPLAL